MLQKALVLVLIVAGISGCIGCGNTSSHYVYATIPAANQVIAYREDPNSGELTETTGSPYSVGDGACSVVLHPSGKFMYVANPGQNENDISLFSIATNGTLTEIPPRASVLPDASQPEVLLMDPAGNYLYVMNTATSNISVFSINSDNGVLSQLAGSPFRIGVAPLNMLLTPSGNYLYVSSSTPLSAGTSAGSIAVFSVTAGIPTLVSLTSSFGINPNGLAIDPSGTYLYAGNTTSNTISIFAIGASGGLTEVSGSPLDDSYNDPISLILDPTGSYLYVANQVSNNVAVYSISSTGLPVALTTSTSTFAFETETNPSFLAADPAGKYLFVGNRGSSAGIQSFELSSGNLEPLFTYGVGNTPSSIAVLQ